jgi:hypothetical protein
MAANDVKTPDTLISALCLDSATILQAPCPPEHADQCWSTGGEQFCAHPKVVEAIARDLSVFDARGLVVTRAACVITCVRRLHDEEAKGLSRLHVDLHAMERLALDARFHSRSDIDVTCGKVGGYARYGGAFGPTRALDCTPLVESRERSEYAISGLGRIAFVRDADGSHPLVAMASLVGKWVRDVLMARIVRHYRRDDASLPEASGYGDVTTSRFIEGSRTRREAIEMPAACFERPGRR